MGSLRFRWYPVTLLGTGLLLAGVGFESVDALVVILVAAAFFLIDGASLDLPRGGVIPLYGGVAVAAAALLAQPQAAGAMLIGIGGAELTRSVGSERSFATLFETGPRVIALIVLCWAYQYVLPHAADSLAAGAILLAGGMVFMLMDLTAYSAARGGFDVASGLSSTGGLLRALGAGYTAQVSVGAVLVLVYPRLDFFAFIVLVPLMLIMQHTTGMLLKVSAAYMRTISVLAEVAEMQTDAQGGHAERVSTLATHVGRVLRIGSQQLERLALASLLHDIGRLHSPQTQNPTVLAESGAAVISRVSFLASLSPIIQKQAVSYRQFLDPMEPDGRLARIIRLVSDVDDIAQEGSLQTDASILNRVSEDDAGVYDPQIVQALRRVVESRGIGR